MFKRITKKQKKREEEEELGLDDDTRQMFGLQDTDSDESSSQSDSDSDNKSDREGVARMRSEWLAAEAGSSGDEDDGDEEGLDIELDDDPPISLEEATKNPIYHVPSEGLRDVRACITCPKKLLKNDKMVQVHLSSAAHVRRFKKFCELAKASNGQTRNPRKIAAAISRKPIAVTNSDGQSKRALKRKQKLDSIKRRREKIKQIIQRKKRKHAKQEAEAEDHGGVHEEGKNSDAGSSKSRPQTSVSDKQASERPRKRRKVAGSDGTEAPRENTSDTQGGDSTKAGDQTETRERVVVVVASAEPKPSKVKPKKVKAKGKSESSAKVKPDADNDKAGGGEQATNTATNGNRSKTARFFEDDGAVKEPSANGGSSRTTKNRDLEKLRTKGHLGKAGAGKFAKLSGTRAVKDKSQRKAPTQGDTARNSLAPKKPTRYFDEAEDGTSSGPKVPSTEKLEQGRKTKSEGKRNNSAKGDGANRIKTAESYGQEKAADDLVIFD